MLRSFFVLIIDQMQNMIFWSGDMSHADLMKNNKSFKGFGVSEASWYLL